MQRVTLHSTVKGDPHNCMEAGTRFKRIYPVDVEAIYNDPVTSMKSMDASAKRYLSNLTRTVPIQILAYLEYFEGVYVDVQLNF